MSTAAFVRPEFRTLGSLPLAALITLSLVYGMHLLIEQEAVEPEEVERRPIPTFVMDDVPDIDIIFDQPKKIVEPETPPPTSIDDPYEVETGNGGYTLPKIKINPSTDKLNINIGGGNLVKQVMIAPTYPRNALRNGTEGFVDIAYDVTAFGGTENITVMYAEPEGVFERAALAAVARWKFRPQVIDNEPVPTQGLKERVRFTIEK
ncbi:TonB family protein [Simiduia curdlanivorans]|uniref:Protein TonB n=1 Tax=Simiduia curdlanivorans TaxID=1492769 RepID=A0ABV8V0Q7_9GAMM|nr:energy transducer TonB [Simiduia curdlanivorans]MDN3637676.1 TonB family protein [Simiduia curdlanivorans]